MTAPPYPPRGRPLLRHAPAPVEGEPCRPRAGWPTPPGSFTRRPGGSDGAPRDGIGFTGTLRRGRRTPQSSCPEADLGADGTGPSAASPFQPAKFTDLVDGSGLHTKETMAGPGRESRPPAKELSTRLEFALREGRSQRLVRGPPTPFSPGPGRLSDHGRQFPAADDNPVRRLSGATWRFTRLPSDSPVAGDFSRSVGHRNIWTPRGIQGTFERAFRSPSASSPGSERMLYDHGER